jgi:chitin synthase
MSHQQSERVPQLPIRRTEQFGGVPFQLSNSSNSSIGAPSMGSPRSKHSNSTLNMNQQQFNNQFQPPHQVLTFDNEYNQPPLQRTYTAPVARVMPRQSTPPYHQNHYNPQNNSNNKQVRRELQQIPLTESGNLVFDIPVANLVAKMGKYGVGEEFTHTRYTAATCDPDDFSKSGYFLRQQELSRQTEMFIVITMYNEDDSLFCKTMSSVFKNIAYLCSRNKSKTWGPEGWKKVVVCIVSDGRAKINSRVLDVLGIMGVYQNGIMKDNVNEKPVTAHIFEYTTQVCVSTDMKVQGHESGFVPVQVLFCLKEKNAKKV